MTPTVRYPPIPSAAVASRRGFALIAILWVLTALAVVVGIVLGATHLGTLTTRNRVILARGRWAAEACLAIAQARWVERRLADADTIDLGRGTRCAWRLEDPTAKLNVNTADREVLNRLVTALGDRRTASDSFLGQLLATRRAAPFTDEGQLAALTGFDPRSIHHLTVDGPGTVNAFAASVHVLAALPGMTPEAVERLASRRALGLPITSLDALAAQLSASARAALLGSYAELARQLTFSAPELVVTTEGWVEGHEDGLRATIEVVVVPLPTRLAVVRRRMR